MAARNTSHLGEFENQGLALKEVKVALHEGLVFVNYDPDAPSLGETIGSVFDDISRLGLDPAHFHLGKVVDYPVRTNWKIAIDN